MSLDVMYHCPRCGHLVEEPRADGATRCHFCHADIVPRESGKRAKRKSNGAASSRFWDARRDMVKTWVEPVGILEIAERLEVQRATVDKWLIRGLLPAARGVVGGRPAWCWVNDIEPWAVDTGRIPQAEEEESF